MDKNKVSMILNSSNQANLISTEESHLLQANLFVLLGKKELNNNNRAELRVPLEIRINKSGEIDIHSLNSMNIDDNHHIFSDKKITKSEKGDN